MARHVSTALQFVLMAVVLAVAVALVVFFAFPAYFEFARSLYPQIAETEDTLSWVDGPISC